MQQLIKFAENQKMPDCLVRLGIRNLCKMRLHEFERLPGSEKFEQQKQLYQRLKNESIAVATNLANEQHYELPIEFFKLVLGPHLKYSGCNWSNGVSSLAEAEAAALNEICQKLQIQDGQSILELGCGWGSLSLWIAKHYPNCTITAITNSQLQKQFIENECHKNNLNNVSIIKIDINDFVAQHTYDCIVSVEMFEHVRNHLQLLKKLSQALKVDGRMFIHIFCHKNYTYLFEARDDSDWMSRYFFTGGMMPAFDYPLHWQQNLVLSDRWFINGQHYQKTAEAWLNNCDKNQDRILEIFRQNYGVPHAKIWLQRWRIFFMACAELFGYRSGEEWHIGHYLFTKKSII